MKTTEAKLTPLQIRQLEIARVAFMTEAPFFSHLYFSLGQEVITRDINTAATDGKRVFLNPDYFCALKVSEQVFVLAHEVAHLVCRHPQRFKHYGKEDGLRGMPWSHEWANVCADYVINADLVDTMPGATINPGWLYDPTIEGSELWEDVYERTLKTTPPPPGGGTGKGRGSGGSAQLPPTRRYEETGKSLRGAKSDPKANASPQPGRFDEVLEPTLDPVTGEEDLADQNEFLEAVSRAAAVAKARGKMPANMQRMVDELLAPQVDWRDKLRLTTTGKIGARGETWARPNRRRLALNPIVVLPGRRGYGCELVVVGVDTSGSIGEHELKVFLSEVGGILSDVKPHKILVIGCDADVSQVDEVCSLDEFEGLRARRASRAAGAPASSRCSTISRSTSLSPRLWYT